MNSAKFNSVQFSRPVVSDSLQPQGLQHARPPCPSPTPRVYPNSCPLSRWCHPTISSSVVCFSSCPQSFPASGSFQMSRVFSNESALCIRWPKYWSFSFNISPSSEHPGLISFRMDWLALPTQWTWVWWWTGSPGVLRFLGSQTVGHSWATELNWYLISPFLTFTILT